MLGQPCPGDDAFWDYALGDTAYAEWLRRVDEMCMRFLDQDLLSMPETADLPGMDLRGCYDAGISCGGYFAELLEHLKAENGSDLIEQYVAQQAKWGILPYQKKEGR
jgi:hypothetical protein